MRFFTSLCSTVYHFDPSNPPPTQAVPTGGNGGTGGGNSSTGMYHSAQRSSSPQQHGMHGAGKKQHKGHQQLSQPQQHQKCQQQFHPVDTTPPPVGVENVSESSTQTVNDCDEVIAKNVGDMNYLDGGGKFCSIQYSLDVIFLLTCFL